MENIKLTIKDNLSVEIYNFDKEITIESNLIECIEKYYKNEEIKIREINYPDLISETAKKMCSLLDPNIPDNGGFGHCSKIEYQNDFFEAQICVPFRARGKHLFRKEQLERFIEHINNYMKTVHPSIRYRLIIIEQDNDRPFNRGFLLNVGFKECEKRPNGYIKYYIHHNCDLFPEIKPIFLDYSYPGSGIRDLFGFSNGLGGICVVNRNAFKLVNGFPNNCIGWGLEDTVIMDRCKSFKIKIIRDQNYNKGIKEENHERDSSYHKLNILNSQDDNKNWKKNGISTLLYTCKINNESEFKNYNVIHYLVDFHV